MFSARQGENVFLSDKTYLNPDASRLSCSNLPWSFQPYYRPLTLGTFATQQVCPVENQQRRVVLTYSLRAVDNQVFVSMCSPARDLSAGYHAVSLKYMWTIKHY